MFSRKSHHCHQLYHVLSYQLWCRQVQCPLLANHNNYTMMINNSAFSAEVRFSSLQVNTFLKWSTNLLAMWSKSKREEEFHGGERFFFAIRKYCISACYVFHRHLHCYQLIITIYLHAIVMRSRGKLQCFVQSSYSPSWHQHHRRQIHASRRRAIPEK